MASIGVVIDPDAGTITTVSPTSLVFGGGVVTPPTDVQVFLPVATGCPRGLRPGVDLLHRDRRADRGNPAHQGRDLPGLDRLLEHRRTCKCTRTNCSNRCAMSSSKGQPVLPGSGHDVPEPRPGRPDHGFNLHDRLGGRRDQQPPDRLRRVGLHRHETLHDHRIGHWRRALVASSPNGVITSVWVSTRGLGLHRRGDGRRSPAAAAARGQASRSRAEALPVASMDVRFQPGPGGTSYVSTLHLSNRRAQVHRSDVRPPARTRSKAGRPAPGAGYYAGWCRRRARSRKPAGRRRQSMLSPDQGALGTDTPDQREKDRDEAAGCQIR